MPRLIESISLREGVIENMQAHRQRIHESLDACFHSQPRWNWDSEIARLSIPSKGWYKLRLVYDQFGVEATFEPYSIRPIASLRIVVGNGIEYEHKFEDRRQLQELFHQRGDCDDVLIIRDGLVTDTSYANIMFRSPSGWVTPTSFLLNGTMRRKLLDSGRITENPIRVEDLSRYSHFRLINALLQENGPESEVSNIR